MHNTVEPLYKGQFRASHFVVERLSSSFVGRLFIPQRVSKCHRPLLCRRHFSLSIFCYVTDPNISFPIGWPSGRYSFPEAREGCPLNFHRGCVYQDDEDSSNANHFTNAQLVVGQFDSNMKLCYCTRLDAKPSVFKWQPGRYCIARKLDACPSLGFETGELYWDDEDSSNDNRESGIPPDGRYDSNTQISYCCRADGDIETPMVMPIDKPFVLYQYNRHGCQKVKDMHATEVILYTDDEDSRNGNRCSNAHPYDDNCSGRDHRVFMCYYHK